MPSKYKKLVRDNIPDIIRANGLEPVTRTLDGKDYQKELIKKLQEEVAEFIKDVNIEELADIQEVVFALAKTLETTPAQLDSVREAKAIKNGRFDKGIYLDSVE